MSNFEDVPFEKPAPNELTIIRLYNGGKNASVKSKKFSRGDHLQYEKVKGGFMRNTLTGEIKKYNKKEFKGQRRVWRIQKEKGEFIRNNFHGLQSEKLLEILFPNPVERNETNKKVKNVRERIQRKFPNTEYIRIILFITPFELVVHIWLKNNDGTPLVIDQATADSICNADERMNVIEITEQNIERLSRYEYNKRFSQHYYPSNMEICSCSKGMKPVEEQAVPYSIAEEKLKDYSPTFQKTKVLVTEVEGEKQVLQQYTFQELVRNDIEVEEKTKMNINEEKSINQVIKEELTKGTITPQEVETTKREMEEFGEMVIVEETISLIQEVLKGKNIIVKRTDIDECQLIDIQKGELLFEGYVEEAANEAMIISKIKESEEK